MVKIVKLFVYLVFLLILLIITLIGCSVMALYIVWLSYGPAEHIANYFLAKFLVGYFLPIKPQIERTAWVLALNLGSFVFSVVFEDHARLLSRLFVCIIHHLFDYVQIKYIWITQLLNQVFLSLPSEQVFIPIMRSKRLNGLIVTRYYAV